MELWKTLKETLNFKDHWKTWHPSDLKLQLVPVEVCQSTKVARPAWQVRLKSREGKKRAASKTQSWKTPFRYLFFSVQYYAQGPNCYFLMTKINLFWRQNQLNPTQIIWVCFEIWVLNDIWFICQMGLEEKNQLQRSSSLRCQDIIWKNFFGVLWTRILLRQRRSDSDISTKKLQVKLLVWVKIIWMCTT